MNEQKSDFSRISEVPNEAWKKLADKKFYFGHQSVGKNILDGISDIMSLNHDIKIKIMETTDPGELEKGVFGHSRIGANSDPVKKLNDFAALMESGIGEKVDFAFVKFCYLDINKDTNVEKLFDVYKDTLDRLQKRFPKTTFIHFTSPLTVSKITWKTKLKKLMGSKDIWEYNDNIKRNQYNTLLKSYYTSKQPVFDIAQLEATKGDGGKYQFEFNGASFYYLAPEYTYDGGHLNELGRKKISEQLLLMILNLS